MEIAVVQKLLAGAGEARLLCPPTSPAKDFCQ